VDLAVDGDGGFLFEVMAEPRIEFVHFLDDAAQVPGLDSELAHAAGVAPAEAGGEDNRPVIVLPLLRPYPHPPSPSGLGPPSPAMRARGRAQQSRGKWPLSRIAGEGPRAARRVRALPSVVGRPASRAATILGGDIGNAVRRRWMALSIALAIAAIGGTMLTSPTPLAPKGWPGFGTSTSTDDLFARIDHEDLAKALGVSVASIRQARLRGDAKGRRVAPRDWENAVIRLAEKQAFRLKQLADALRKENA
jgi:hypothetical protein